jgi:hypothetical protein
MIDLGFGDDIMIGSRDCEEPRFATALDIDDTLDLNCQLSQLALPRIVDPRDYLDHHYQTPHNR